VAGIGRQSAYFIEPLCACNVEVEESRCYPRCRLLDTESNRYPVNRWMIRLYAHHHDAIALQLWMIRDAMASDPDEALRRVKAVGFSAVEIAPLPPGLTVQRLADSLARHGFAVVSIHGDLPAPENIVQWTLLAREYRCSQVIWHGWSRDPRFDSLAGIRDLISACNLAGAIARDHGLKLGLHNHWWEFEPVERERPIRMLHESLSPDIFWQIDVYWAQTSEADPAAVLAELSTRIRSLHLKDGPAAHGEPMTALGRGVVDIPRILRAPAHPVDWVIELDESATDPVDAARESRVYLELQNRRG
jgi:sugar phosphate isomerase/epimerase